MKPLANNLTSFSDFESSLSKDLPDGHVIGFLLDSRFGELKKSGLIMHRDAVMPLHHLLGQRATLFYPDPRGFEGKAYLEAVRDFSQKLLVSEHIRYEVELPAIAPTIVSELGGLLAGLNLDGVHTGFRFHRGFLPRILGPCMIPKSWPKSSNSL